MSQTLAGASRAQFLAIADVLIPEAEGMPSATQAGVGGDVLDRALALRPDLKDDLFRGLQATAGQDPAVAAQALYRADTAAFAAIGLLASACYYMIPRVRELIGYPGQQKVSYDPDSTPEYITSGMLQPVVNRGPIYRQTPGLGRQP